MFDQVDEPLVVLSSCRSTSASDRPSLRFVIRALKESMPPYLTEYLGGRRPARIAGRCSSASSSHVVTCAMMSRSDHRPVTPGSSNCASVKPAYDSLNAIHALSSRFRSFPRSMSCPRPRSLRVVEDHAQGVTAARADPAHAVPQIHPIGSPRSLDRAMVDGEDDAISL